MLFCGDSAGLTHCAHCGTSRRDDQGAPIKQFHSLPLMPQLLRMYADADTAARLRWAGEHEYDPDIVCDVTESPRFAAFARADNFMVDDVRNISLAFCTDGINPWKKSQYSMWPLFATVLNFSPDMRDKPENMILLGLVPGPKSPKRMNTFLRPVVDELLGYGESGLDTFDAHTNTVFNMRVRMALFIADYPASSKVMCMKGSGAVCGCHHCNIRGRSTATASGSKTIYPDFRRYLPADHEWRFDDNTFGSVETRPAPRPRDHASVEQQARATQAAYDLGVKPDSTADPSAVTGVTGYSELLRLPYRDHILDSPVEMMHLVVRCNSFYFLP